VEVAVDPFDDECATALGKPQGCGKAKSVMKQGEGLNENLIVGQDFFAGFHQSPKASLRSLIIGVCAVGQRIDRRSVQESYHESFGAPAMAANASSCRSETG